MISSNEFFEHKSFNGWKYGVSKKEAKNSQVLIQTPSGIHSLPLGFLSRSIVIYFDIPTNVRKQRMQERGTPISEIDRRITADYLDFDDFAHYDIRIRDPYYNPDELLKTIKAMM